MHIFFPVFPKHSQSGQTLVEFILLLASMFIITIIILRGFNIGIAEYWKTYIQVIALPSPSNIDFN